ncbi:unnamed protein product, partial [Ectocarpus fasciculatus]
GATAGRWYGPIDGLRGLPLGPVPPRGDGLPEPVRGDRSGFPAAAGGEGDTSAAVEDPQRPRLRRSGTSGAGVVAAGAHGAVAAGGLPQLPLHRRAADSGFVRDAQ